MIRTFKYISLVAAGTPQPVFGTTLTAAVSPGSQVSVPVTDSSLFLKGDQVNFDVGTSEERTVVASVPDSTHIVVNLMLAHANGTYVRLSGAVSVVYIQTKDGNTSPIFIGNKPTMVKATGVGCIAKLFQVAAGNPSIDFSSTVAGFPGPLSYGEFWFDGTTNTDSILPSVSVD